MITTVITIVVTSGEVQIRQGVVFLQARFPICTWGFLRLVETVLKLPFEHRRPRLDCAAMFRVTFDTAGRPNRSYI